jgi:hypothetical protein
MITEYMECDAPNCDASIPEEDHYKTKWGYVRNHGDMCPKHNHPCILSWTPIHNSFRNLNTEISAVYGAEVLRQLKSQMVLDPSLPKDKVFIFHKKVNDDK